MVGFCHLTDSHHYHHGQKPTMVGICHGGNMPVGHNDHCGAPVMTVIMMIALMVMVVWWLEGVCPMLIILWLDPPLLLYLCLLLLSSLKPSCHHQDHHYSKHVIVISTHTHTHRCTYRDVSMIPFWKDCLRQCWRSLSLYLSWCHWRFLDV